MCDVETVLKQRWYNFISTLFQLGLYDSKSYIKSGRPSDKYRLATSISKFYSSNYFEQYIHNSITNKLVNSSSNFLAVYIGYKGENGEAHKKLEALKFQNLKTSLKTPEALLRSLEFVIHQNLQQNAITVSNSDQLPLSKHIKLAYSKPAPTNVE